MEKKLLKKLETHLPINQFKEVCTYLFKKPGKLFRTQLLHHLATDLGKISEKDILSLASFVEIHHTYTLIHDDLPAMDNDDYRRGILATHKKFGEASGILAGDALLNASFACLSPVTNLSTLLKVSTWATGAKGLIGGQFFDLEKRKKNYDEIMRIHELKTARLFQVCTLGILLIKIEDASLTTLKDFMRLGRIIGLLFQILDDKKDKADKDSEFNNLFIIAPEKTEMTLKKLKKDFKRLTDKYQLNETYNFITGYTNSQSDSF